MKRVIVFFFTWLIIINVYAVLANNRVNLSADTSYPWINPEYTFQYQEWNVVDLHSKWDSYWYLDIVNNGYQYRGELQLSNIVFFPLYPMLIKILGALFSISFILAGWIVSSLFALFTSIYLYKIVKEFHPQSDPFLSVVMLLVFPTAFFLNTIYTESTFLFFSVASFYHALKKQYVIAGLFGLFASLTRLTGILLFIPLLIEYINANRQKLFSVNVLPLFLIPIGTMSFLIYHFIRFNDIMLFFKVENWWGRGFSFNPVHFSFTTYPSIINFSLDAFLCLFTIVAILLVSTRLRLSYGVYMLSTLLAVLSSGTLMSIGRYILVLFPTYILGASIKNKDYSQLWILVSTLFFALYTLLFVTHYWAG